MSQTRVIHSTSDLATPAGAQLTLTLSLTAGALTTHFGIDRVEVLPHKQLRSTVLSVTAPTDGAQAMAEAITTVAHELNRLHRQGYWLRERSVGMRGIWHNDLCDAAGRLAQSWQTTPKRPGKVIEPLAAALAALDVPVAREAPPDRGQALEEIMRERSAERRREHDLNDYLAADPLGSADELVDHLEARDHDKPV